VLKNTEESAKELALTVASKDKYFPKRTGLYALSLEEMITSGPERLTQLWSYDANTKTLFSKKHAGSALFEGGNKLPAVFDFKGMKN
jgi:hypothetical protein